MQVQSPSIKQRQSTCLSPSKRRRRMQVQSETGVHNARAGDVTALQFSRLILSRNRRNGV
jgi:hypothetical protein